MKSEAEIRAYLKLREKQLAKLNEIIDTDAHISSDIWDQVGVTLGNIEAIKFVLGET